MFKKMALLSLALSCSTVLAMNNTPEDVYGDSLEIFSQQYLKTYCPHISQTQRLESINKALEKVRAQGDEIRKQKQNKNQNNQLFIKQEQSIPLSDSNSENILSLENDPVILKTKEICARENDFGFNEDDNII